MLLKGKKDVIATPCVSGYKSKHLKRKNNYIFFTKKDAVVLLKRERK